MILETHLINMHLQKEVKNIYEYKKKNIEKI